MSEDVFSFVIYIIHACACKWDSTPSDVYLLLKKTGCIEGFLVRDYDALHTLSTWSVVSDVEEYLSARSVRACSSKPKANWSGNMFPRTTARPSAIILQST